MPDKAEIGEDDIDGDISMIFSTERAAIAYIHFFFLEMRKSKDYGMCDRVLKRINVEVNIPAILITILTVTAPIKNKLNNREDFYNRAKKAIEQLRGPEMTEQLLVGLE